MKLRTLDLHKTRHSDVPDRVCDFLNWVDPPCKIITGKSSKMREIVEKIVYRYGYNCYSESASNYGCLIVVDFNHKDL